MKFVIVFCALVAAVAGDVSDLPSNNYLPPAHHYAASAPAVSFSAAPAYHVEAASAPAVPYSAPAAQSYQVEAASAPGFAYAAPADESYNIGAASAPAVSYSAPAGNYESASYEGAASEPAHTFSSAEGYRYKTARRRVIRRRRDVSSEYLPPAAASAPVAQFESAPSYSAAASEPAVQYSAPASYESASYEGAASEPAHSYSAEGGYRYKAVRRRVIRRQRRDVSHLSSEYLPPAAASAPAAQYESAPSYSGAASEANLQYAAPSESYETASYETAATEPAHSYSSNDGYRYRAVKRRVIRRQRRDVSHLSSEYLPPAAASAPAAQYESAPSYSGAASEANLQYAAPSESYETASYETAATEPAHSYTSNDGYRYRAVKRRVIRRQRRDVSHLSSEYLPPAAASAPAAQYESAPSYSGAASEANLQYAAPSDSYETASYETAATEPAHSYTSNDGYRYRAVKRRVIRRQRRDVSHLSSEYLPPAAASAPAAQYESAPSYSGAASEANLQYAAPSESYETSSYETAATEPAHSYSSNDGYRYKAVQRRVIRRQRRDVSHLSSEYLPPAAASAPAAQYESAPSYSGAASEANLQYAAPSDSYETGSYETAATEPAHSYSSNDGYRYKAVKRRVIRRQRRDVSHLSSEYLPPAAASAPAAQYESAPSYSGAASEANLQYAAPSESYETASYETAATEPAHSYTSNDGYRYKAVKRRVIRRQRRDVSHLSSEYLPPAAASAPAAQYESAPSYSGAASEANLQYAAPSDSYETASYETAATEPAHFYSSAEGYRYKTAKRRVIRRRRY